MTLSFNNFGPISKGEINLDREFIIFCGKNNSGKTYLSYFLYGLLNDNSKLTGFDSHKVYNFVNFDNVLLSDDNAREKKAVIKLDLKDIYINNKEKILSEYGKFSNEILNDVFPDNKSLSSAKFYFEIGNEEKFLTNLFQRGQRATSTNADSFAQVSFVKEADSYTIIFEASHPNISENEKLTPEIIQIILKYILTLYLVVAQSKVLHRCYCFPAERIALDVFGWDIIHSRPAISEDMQGHHAISYIQYSPAALEHGIGGFRRNFRDTDKFYPLPVHDFLIRTSSYGLYKAGRGYLYETGRDLENRLGIKIDNTELLQTNVELEDGDTIPLKLSSSTIKSLTSFIIYLKHESKKNDAVFFDEPELGLHPDLQRKLAVTLARIVKKGIRLVISTHSDYMLREFNNLIMLNQQTEKAKNLRVKYSNIGYDSQATLDFSNIGVYLCESGLVSSIPVTNSGFDVSSIDKVINEQNAISEDIYFDLF